MRSQLHQPRRKSGWRVPSAVAEGRPVHPTLLHKARRPPRASRALLQPGIASCHAEPTLGGTGRGQGQQEAPHQGVSGDRQLSAQTRVQGGGLMPRPAPQVYRGSVTPPAVGGQTEAPGRRATSQECLARKGQGWMWDGLVTPG